MSLVSAAPVDQGMETLLALMRERSLAPLWSLYEQIVLREPQGTEAAHHWSWAELSELVSHSMGAVAGELADHRVLLLTHPAFGGRIATTGNLLAGVQCVMPGERTIAHRHTASAVRFVIESAGADTYVDGKACPMAPGDVILTPNWTWHSHANHSERPAVWIDMLDVPAMAVLRATFGERNRDGQYHGSTATLPDESFANGGLAPVTSLPVPEHSSRLRWRREDVLEALRHSPAQRDGSRLLRYTNPLSGRAVTCTMDVYAQQLIRAQTTAPYRCSGSALCVVVDGEGESQVGDALVRWRANDVFTLPNWTMRTHRATSGTAQLLVVSDYELYRRAGLWREEYLQ